METAICVSGAPVFVFQGSWDWLLGSGLRLQELSSLGLGTRKNLELASYPTGAEGSGIYDVQRLSSTGGPVRNMESMLP